MKKLILSLTMLVSTQAFAIDLSNDQVPFPAADATEITREIAKRGAVGVAEVICKFTGPLEHQVARCSTTRVIYQNETLREEGFGCMFEYDENSDGTYTRSSWECPIL